MSDRDGFTGGFIAGAIFGSIVGGAIGAFLASRVDNDSDEEERSLLKSGTELKFNTEESIEVARQGLEDKIAQLNLAIDDVRQQLSTVNRNGSEND
ncbi:MAG: hypothetical protein F6K10_37990 [Moorea sp. SIO2B7]|nr:hypothetical protein [Moorena sp. SIO2B7]